MLTPESFSNENYDVFSEGLKDFFKSKKFETLKSNFKFFKVSTFDELLKFKFKNISISKWIDDAIKKILTMGKPK